MSHGKSKWGNYIGAPKVIDAAINVDFGDMFRNNKSDGGIGGVHKLHYIHEYSEADEAGGGYSTTVAGQVVYTLQNVTGNVAFNWTVPSGVTSVSAVCVGVGGAGGGNNGSSGHGASGRAGVQLTYARSISRNPRET